MRSGPGLFALSVGLNLALGSVWLLSARRSPDGAAAAPQAPVAEVAAAPVTDAVASAPSSTSGAPTAWAMLESDDYRKYISNLRAVSCPEAVIRDIIVADLDDLYQR